jgi:sugar transferase (PEP-CTERM system associated)
LIIRLVNVHYRTLVLLVVETLIVWASFVLGTMRWSQQDRLLLLNNELFIEDGFLKILVLTMIVLMLFHRWDLYDSSNLSAKREQNLRLFLVLTVVTFFLAAVDVTYKLFMPKGSVFLPGSKWGVLVLVVALFGWRAAYGWIVQQPYFRERVYVLGTGDRAQRLLDGLRQRSELGIEVVGWTGNIEGELTRETVATHLVGLASNGGVHRVIVAMPDRRGTLPVDELLDLRLEGVKVEEATSWLEKIYGRIEVEHLNPSWLVFAEGFRFNNFYRLMRRVLNFSVALIGLLMALPLLPFIALAVKLGSPGPVFYHQKRVGRRGVEFYCHKFRTMRQDAEADTGATWATDDDPRITRVGKILRVSRLDEIPQLWCVLTGDMHFVGPRPERPEFVGMLIDAIPYYNVRHTVRPGITGWAQVQYKYGNTVADAREKLQYDLFYIKNASIFLDMLIMFQTIKIVMLGRGAK